MTTQEKEIHAALTEFFEATKKSGSTGAGGRDRLSAALTRLSELPGQLGPDAHPMLRHYLERRSYQKALEFLNSGEPETEKPQCGH